MIRINYKRLFNLVIGHDYFADGHDRFISLVPTDETIDLFNKGKMLYKKLPHGNTLLYRAGDDEVTEFVSLDPNQHFVFKIEVSDYNSFLNITDLDESVSKKFKSGNLVFLTNDPTNPSSNQNAPEILSLELIDSMRSQLFTYAYSVSGSPAISYLTVRDRSGTAVAIGKDTEGDPLPIPMPVDLQSNGTYSQSIDLRSQPKGKYTLTIANIDGTTVFAEEEIYVDNKLDGKNILGIVDLEYNNDNPLYGDTEEYKISFKRLASIWKYFIVNKSGNVDFSSKVLSINDAGSTNGGPYVTNDFDRSYAGILLTADAVGPGGNTLALSYSGTGNPPAVLLSGKFLSGGDVAAAATGNITIINNDLEDYQITIGSVTFTEGSEFEKGTTAADTASELVTAINANGSVEVGAALLSYDTLVNDFETLVFSSDDGIPFFETPKLKLELRNTTDSQTIIPHLSNPSPAGKKKEYDSKTESEIYVFI